MAPLERKSVAVGIDLGTSFSAVAIYVKNCEDKRAHVVYDRSDPKRNPSATTPSVVAFTPKKYFVGHRAVDQMVVNPENTVSEIKRLMGRKFNEPQVVEDNRRWPFTLTDNNGEPRLRVHYRHEIRQFRPEQIYAMILTHLRLQVCEYLEWPKIPIDAVLTVPINFGDSQRVAVKEACEIAGVRCVRMITEPAAVALAYGWETLQEQREKDTGGRILVVDSGGGTTDVALLRLGKNHQYEVLSCVGADLGGEDFDTLLVNYCIENNTLSPEIKAQIKSNYSAMMRIRRACEHTKCTLSSAAKAVIEIDEIIPGVVFKHQISQTDFQDLINDKLVNAVEMVQECFQSVQLKASDISKVVLAGGSSRIPALQALIKKALPNIPILTNLCKDEVVACGAALQAAKDSGILDLCLVERIPWSLGVELFDGINNRVIEKYSTIPIKESRTYHTATHNQTSLVFDMYEGENLKSKDNKFLASMTLENIRKAAECEVAAEATFEIDHNGILQVTAKELGSDNEISVRIERYKLLLNASEVEGLAKNTETEHLNGVVHDLQEQVEALGVEVAEEYRTDVELQVARVQEWTQENPMPTAENFGQLLHSVQEGLKHIEGVTVSEYGRVTHKNPK